MLKVKNYFENSDISELPTYFIADIAANHDGSISKAKELIHAASENGANAAKFQNFKAETIVSDIGFSELGKKISHQSKWDKSVFEVYKSAELPIEWSEELKECCHKYSIEYFSAPYDQELSVKLRDYSNIVKVGSGEITWIEHLKLLNKIYDFVIVATGASDILDVKRAIEVFKENKTILMQCNTNYTANLSETSEEKIQRFKNLNLEVLSTYSKIFPNIILGLSDHTLSNTSVIISIAKYKCKFIEKHFTLDNNSEGPDHPFSMNPANWKNMVDNVRNLETQVSGIKDVNIDEIIKDLVDDPDFIECFKGDGIKKIEKNELDTSMIQRRGIYINQDLEKGTIIEKKHLKYLRPIVQGGINPYENTTIIGKELNCYIKKDYPLLKKFFDK